MTHLHKLLLACAAVLMLGASGAYATDEGPGWGGNDPDYTTDPGPDECGCGGEEPTYEEPEYDDEDDWSPPETPHTTGGGGNTPVDTAVYCITCGYNSVDLLYSYEGVDSFGNPCTWYVYVDRKGQKRFFPFALPPDGHGHYRM